MAKSDKHSPRKNLATKDPKDITEVACWIEAREFTNLVLGVTRGGSFADEALLVDVIQRACLTMTAKISDGYHRRSDEMFVTSLEEARGFLGQTVSHLYLASDQGLLDHDQLNDLLTKAYTVGIRINSHLKTLSGPKAK